MKTWRMAGLALVALPLFLADAAPVQAQPIPNVSPSRVVPRAPRVKPRPARVAPRTRPPVVAPGVPRPAVVPRRLPKP